MERLITAVIPAFGGIDIVSNSVVSLAKQWIPDNTFKLEVIIVDDNPKSNYDYFLTEGFGRIVGKNVEIKIIKNDENYGQGVSRQIGIDNASSDWVLLCDEDDMYAPNAVYRFWEILNEQHCGGDNGKPLAMLAAPLYTFDKNKERKIINSASIWVNGKLYNRQFLRDNRIKFPTGKSSHRSEDYPFIRMIDYAIANNSNYKRIDFTEEADTFYYWIPNNRSRTHVDRFYTALLTPFTMKSACMIFRYYKWFNKEHNLEADKDEEMKHEILSMNVYAYFNYNTWLKFMSDGWADDEKCVEEDWEMYKKALAELRSELSFYWKEICPTDVTDMFYRIKHNSDIQFVEPFICPFDKWVAAGDKTLKMSFAEIKRYCSELNFDPVGHETHTAYVKAWTERHKEE